MEQRISEIEKQIKHIQVRNSNVELEKAWETSLVRKVAIATMTYIIMCMLMFSLGTKEFYLSALVPTTGFVLSTLSLPFVKQYWLRSRSI